MFLAATAIAREYERAMALIGGACVILLIGITVVMVWFVVKYRRGKATTTRQIKGNTLLEIVWVVIPTFIVTWMFFVGYRGFELARHTPEGAQVVKVTGKQWVWTFDYPDKGISSGRLVVPVNRPIKVEITSQDVNHSFFIPDFRVKEDAVPGKITHLWFKAEQEGTHNVFCAEFCGKDHAYMSTTVEVVSQKEYEAWVRDEQLKRYRPLEFEAVVNPKDPGFGPDQLNIDARRLYMTFCATCHGLAGDGSGLPAAHPRDFRSTANWKRSAKVVDIYRTLMEGIEGTQMRAYPNFTPWERVALAHYVRSFLKEKPPADSEEDYKALVAEYGLDKVQAPKQSIPIEKAMKLLVAEAGTTQTDG
jgi:cytochrome c oxidase subunit II